MELLITFSMFIVVFTLYIIYNLLKKNELYEDEIEVLYTTITERENELEKLYKNVVVAVKTMKEIDSQELFENDDYVGSVFKELISVTNYLESLLYEDIDGTTKEDGPTA